MTCGSKKHIEETLAKIRVKDVEDFHNEQKSESKPEPESKSKRKLVA
jgi:hypothetical protein